MTKSILVTGGAGYIGSHMMLALRAAGYQPVTLDQVNNIHLHDSDALDTLFQTHSFAAAMHFAAFIEVGESVLNPVKYYYNNVSGTLNLLRIMHKHEVKNIIFSSTAAVYGQPQTAKITEDHPLLPINPYGQGKLMVERILQDMASAGQLRYSILRYFNAAGADPAGRAGERHEPESHLIPLILQAAARLREHIAIYGHDYPTPDGTCVRDYVHVSDLCDAHLLALQALLYDRKSDFIFNLGNERGYSVLEVVNAAREVTGCEIPLKYSARRAGDPAILVADSGAAREQLGWQPKYSDIHTMIKHAWDYCHSGLPALC